MTSFSERLRALREKRKLTQQELADTLGVTRPTYTRWENGTRKPDKEKIVKLADLLDTNIDFLAGKIDNNKSYEQLGREEIEKIGGIENLPEDVLKKYFNRDAYVQDLLLSGKLI